MNAGRLRIAYPVIVEGKYDRLRLDSVLDADILTTEGFGLFRQKEKQTLLRKLAEKSQLIVLTDSDGAGKIIRSRISSLIPPGRLIQLYIPRIEGTEKRKKTPSAEGTLGVEGMERALLYRLFLPYAGSAPKREENPVTKTDFYLDGLSGKPDSRERRNRFAAELGLPPDLTPNALLSAVKMVCTPEEYRSAVAKIKEE